LKIDRIVWIIKIGRVYNVSLERGMKIQIPNEEKIEPRSFMTSPLSLYLVSYFTNCLMTRGMSFQIPHLSNMHIDVDK
jgi:hypothetical protein